MDIRNKGLFQPKQVEDPGFEVTRISEPLEMAQASFREGLETAETFSLYRYVRRKVIEQDDDITDPRKLNEEFPGMDTPFVKPTSYALAKDMYDRNQKRKERMGVLARGEDGFGTAVANFGAMALPQIFDPVNIGMSFVGGAGIIKGLAHAARLGQKMKAVKTSAKLAKAAQNLQKLSGYNKKFFNLAAGTGSAAVSEFAIIRPSTEADKMDYSLNDAMMNTLIGGVGFPLVFEGIGLMGKGLAKSGEYMYKSAPRMEKAYAYVENALQLGKKVDMDEIARTTANGEIPRIQKRVDSIQADIDRMSIVENPTAKQRKALEAKQKKLAKATEELDEAKGIRGEEIDALQMRQRANAPERDIDFFEGEPDMLKQMEQMPDETLKVADGYTKQELEDMFLEFDGDEGLSIREDAGKVDELDNIYKSLIGCMEAS